jgi:hypothetical protein
MDSQILPHFSHHAFPSDTKVLHSFFECAIRRFLIFLVRALKSSRRAGLFIYAPEGWHPSSLPGVEANFDYGLYPMALCHGNAWLKRPTNGARSGRIPFLNLV